MSFNRDLHDLLKATKKVSRPLAESIEQRKVNLGREGAATRVSGTAVSPRAFQTLKAPDKESAI